MSTKTKNIYLHFSVVFCILPLAVAGFICLLIFQESLKDATADKTRQTAVSMAREVEFWLQFQSLNLELSHKGSSPSQVSSLDLPFSTNHNPEFLSMIIFDQSRKSEHGVSYGHAFNIGDFSVENFASQVQNHNRPMLSQAIPTPRPGEIIAAFGRPISQGVIVGFIDLTAMQGLLARKLPSSDWKAALVDQNGQVVFHTDPRVPKVLEQLPDKDIKNKVNKVQLLGEPYLTTQEAIPNTEWSVIVLRYMGRGVSPISSVILVMLVGIAMALLLGFLFIMQAQKNLRRTEEAGEEPSDRKALSGLLAGNLSNPFFTIRQPRAEDTQANRGLAFLEGIEDAYYESEQHGIITLCNDSLCELVGYSREEMAGFRIQDIVEFDSEFDEPDIFAKVWESEQAVSSVRWSLLRKDGQRLQVEGSVSLKKEEGQPVGFRGIIRDITHRLEIEQELAQTKKFLENLMESSPDTIVSTDTHGRIEYVTSRVGELLGYTQEEVLGTRVLEYYSLGLEDAKSIMARLGVQEGFTNHSLQMRRKSGEMVDVNASVSLLRNECGDVVGTLGVLRDETYNKRLEASLQHAQKMEAIGTLAGGVAHDFNNLLMGMQGYVSLMLLETTEEKPEYERLKRIEHQINSGSDLTRQLLSLARGGKREVKPEHPGGLVANAAEMFGRTRKEIRIRQKSSHRLWTVEVDRGQIEQVLLNLFMNAWHAMPDGGDIFLDLSNTHIDKENAQALDLAPGDYVCISVKDTGDGMDEDIQARVFDPFFSTKKRGQGTGLGLTTTYGIMRNHCGAITVESTLGDGSTFCLYLPASLEHVAPQISIDEDICRGSQTVLLVDDEDMVLEVGAEMMRALGYTVHVAASGEEALACLAENQEAIDLVILDVVMPNMNGEETYRRIREMDAHVKVLLSSGYSVEGRASRILRSGGASFVQKPFNISTLSQALHQAFSA